jgi:type I restriction-modification system DNA methylase subunit
LKQYFEDVNKQGSEAGKAFLFLEFVRDVFKQIDMDYLESLYPQIEKHIKLKTTTLVVRGRPDAFLGNLIIEFKKNLDKASLDEAKHELKKYIAILWTEQSKYRIPYLTIATDGVNFVVFRPRTKVPEGDTVLPDDVNLDEIDRVNLLDVKVGHAFLWLDRYMLYHVLKPATAQEFSKEFGLNMPAYKEAVALLVESWKKVKEKTLYDQWAEFLRIVYGSNVESEELFIKHTYLATLAKLLAYATFSGGALPVSDEQLMEILEGRIFSEKWGVQNFLEEDFFSWVAREENGLRATRMILERLDSYDLSKVDEDILKGLYQELVDPQARHDLGEYYTPDWLAELMVNDVVKTGKESLLDPACGSGTFLAAAIRRKKELLGQKVSKSELIEEIISSVQGVDVHPLAVILSRTTYLLSLGTDLLNARRSSIAVPIYMANSIRLPDEDMEIFNQIECYKIKADSQYLRVPRKVAENPEFTDVCVEVMKDYARTVASGETLDEEAFHNFLFQRVPHLLKDKQGKGIAKVLYESATVMAALIQRKRDTVWGFILKNIYKPLFLKKEKFDILIGNPPWISYRYIESTDYQNYLKKLIMEDYGLLDSNRAELITQMEIATLFFLRCSELYLNQKGIISFVMPRGVFVSDQHHNFRSALYKADMELVELIDLEDVAPLFKVPSCVVKGKAGKKTRFPIKGRKISGVLPQKNIRLNIALKILKFLESKFRLYTIGGRTFFETEDFSKVLKAVEAGLRSDYYKNFTQGATIVPRQLWFIELIKHPKLALNPQFPTVKTSSRAITKAKREYKDVSVEGAIEVRFLFNVVTGSELVPFGHLTLPIAVLPIEPNGSSFRIINVEEASVRGFFGLKMWLQNAEQIWYKKRREKADKLNIYDRLDYSKGLTSQSSRLKYKVLYNTSGTYLVASVAQNGARSIKVDGSVVNLSGLIADAKTYFYDTSNEDEAFFIASILNAPIIDKLIKPMQSRGLWGERDIHKKVLELPIPRYNPKDELHTQLVAISKECHKKVKEIIPALEQKYTSIGKIRAEVKEAIEHEISEIDRIVRQLLLKTGTKHKSMEYFIQT